MHLKPGDRLTDSTGEWEVVGRPDVTDIRTSCAHEHVRVKELYEYLEQQVTRKSRAVGGNQHPVMKGANSKECLR